MAQNYLHQNRKIIMPILSHSHKKSSMIDNSPGEGKGQNCDIMQQHDEYSDINSTTLRIPIFNVV